MKATIRTIMATAAVALMLQGCGFVAGTAVGGTAGYLLHEEGYRVRSPVSKNEPQGYNLRSPIVREPGH
jgi:hypothetical protein